MKQVREKKKEGCIESQESFMFFPELLHIFIKSLHLKGNNLFPRFGTKKTKKQKKGE